MRYVFLFLPLVMFALEPILETTDEITSDPLIITSDNGYYTGNITYGAGNSEYITIAQFVLKDRDGTVLLQSEAFGHTLVDIANNGMFVGIDFDGPISGKGMLHFYDHGGNKLNSHSVGFLRERGFSRSGDFYCVNDGAAGLRVFSSFGEELYDLGPANYFSMSDNGTVIAAARDAKIDIYEQGMLIRTVPLTSPFIREMAISQENSLLVWVDKKRLYCCSTETGNMVFTYDGVSEHLSFISCDVSPDGRLIAAGLDEDQGKNSSARHTRGMVVLLGSDGSTMWSRYIPYTRWNIHVPRVSFSSPSSFTVETVENIQEYSF